MPFLPPNQQRQSTEGTILMTNNSKIITRQQRYERLLAASPQGGHQVPQLKQKDWEGEDPTHLGWLAPISSWPSLTLSSSPF